MSSITVGKFVYKHYIDRDALLDFAHNHKDGQIGCNDIARFPTADVVDVRHGKAICHDHDEWWGAVYECILCGEKWMLECSSYKAHYCPWCGAKMDGERKNKTDV